MGQATVDLPDPGEVPAAPMSSADDLLSQMAGDEIDRLLAEADVDKNTAPSEAGRVQVDEEKPITGAQIDELFKTIDANEGGASEPEAKSEKPHKNASLPPAPSEALRIDTAPLDLNAKPKKLEEALAGEADPALPEAKALEAETSTVEKNALATAIDSLQPPGESSPADDDTPVPFYLKPLVWLNLPMELLPLEARDVLGKVALLTLANAIAVLGYVLIFRRHH